MRRDRSLLHVLGLAAITLGLADTGEAVKFKFARIYIEYNSSANDLGFHVTLDAEDWKDLEIENPRREVVFEAEGLTGFGELGMTELFFEGAEPSLDDFPLADLLALFPEGKYRFSGETVDERPLTSTSMLTHAVPAGPAVSAEVSAPDSIVVRWEPVTAPPPGFPARKITIVGYQVLVDSFQVTLPATATELTLPAEFAASLGSGEHPFEVLAIEAGGNQTITEGTFEVP